MAIRGIYTRQLVRAESDCTLDGPDGAVHTDLVMKPGLFHLKLMTFAGRAGDHAADFSFFFVALRPRSATGSPERSIALR